MKAEGCLLRPGARRWLRRLSWLAVVLPLLASAQISRPDGPGARKLGQAQGYPGCPGHEAILRLECRVGTWSANHRFAPARTVAPAAEPRPLPRMAQPPEIRWRWGLFSRSVDDFLDETQTTGLLILKDGQIVVERYQYGRQPDMPLRSFSMAKTVTAMLVGIAVEQGAIRSLDDRVADYWPEISASAYGQTSLRHLLRMASGVPFRELYTWTPDDDMATWGRLLSDPAHQDQPARVTAFLNERTERDGEPGARFRYATIETDILGRVLMRATGRNLTELTERWLWQPMGAEFPAYWLYATTDGAEEAGHGFNATLRDYARLGLLLAQDGQRDGRAIIPRDFLLEATDPARQPPAFRPGVATPGMGYGYQVWLLPLKTRTFLLQGVYGQHILIQPETGIVIVQTSVNDRPSGRQDARPYQLRDAFWRGVVYSLGGRWE